MGRSRGGQLYCVGLSAAQQNGGPGEGPSVPGEGPSIPREGPSIPREAAMPAIICEQIATQNKQLAIAILAAVNTTLVVHGVRAIADEHASRPRAADDPANQQGV